MARILVIFVMSIPYIARILVIFVPQIIVAGLICGLIWFILSKKTKAINPYYIAIISCIIPLIIGFVISHRQMGYILTLDYLENINNQKITTTGYSITSEEENLIKEELRNNNQFTNSIDRLAILESSVPSIATIGIMLFIARKRKKEIEKIHKT